MGMIQDTMQSLREIAALPFLMIGMAILGTTVFRIDGSTRKVSLKSASKVTEGGSALRASGTDYPDMGAGCRFRLLGSTVGIGVEDVEALLNPAVMQVLYMIQQVEEQQVEEADLQEEPRDPDEPIDDGDDDRRLAGLRDWLSGLFDGSSDGGSDGATRAATDGGVATRTTRTPTGVETGAGESLESLLHQDDDEAPIVGEPEPGQDADDYDGAFVERVPLRDTMLVPVEIIRDYKPFDMMDGRGFQKALHYSRESQSEYQDSSVFQRYVFPIVMLILGYYFGGSGTGGGGGGGGGPSIPLPMIDMAGPMTDLLGVTPALVDLTAVVM